MTPNVVLLCGSFYPFLLSFILLARCCGYRCCYLFHEWHLSMQGTFWQRANYAVLDATFGYLVDGILPISKGLEQKAGRFGKKMMRLPVLGDFSNCPTPSDAERGHANFVYCAHAGYFRVIQVLLEAMEILHAENPDVTLTLILSGNESALARVAGECRQKNLESCVRVRTKVSHPELTRLYQDAAALLIPLDPDSLQDQMRFSQKIAEYAATARPIITNQVGEIPYYFKDRESAFLVPEYRSAAFAAVMEQVLAEPEQAAKIGYEGYLIGRNNFHFAEYGEKAHIFFESLSGSHRKSSQVN